MGTVDYKATRTYKVSLDADDVASLQAKCLADDTVSEEHEHITNLVYACTVQVDNGDMQGILYLIDYQNPERSGSEMEWLDYEPADMDKTGWRTYATVRFEAEDTDWDYEGTTP